MPHFYSRQRATFNEFSARYRIPAGLYYLFPLRKLTGLDDPISYVLRVYRGRVARPPGAPGMKFKVIG